MAILKKIVELNNLLESDSQLIGKLLFYWANVVCDTIKLKCPVDILK